MSQTQTQPYLILSPFPQSLLPTLASLYGSVRSVLKPWKATLNFHKIVLERPSEMDPENFDNLVSLHH